MRASAVSLFLLTAALCVALPAGAEDDLLLESDAVLPGPVVMPRTKALLFLHEAAYTIKVAGYSCDTVSGLAPMLLRRGFTVSCNRFAYEYEFLDVGGHWEVLIDGRVIANDLLSPPAAAAH